jgi:acetolactate synthase-1/2/3 large subunit
MTDETLRDEPILVNINVIENENCYPMVAPGKSNSQMLGLENQER